VAAPRRVSHLSALLLAALAWAAPASQADEHNGCASVNNTSNNRISVFETVGANGELKWVQEVTTGGIGSNGGFYSIPQIASTKPRGGHACVFAVNAATDDISAFQVTIDHETPGDCPCKHQQKGGGPISIGSDALFGRLGGGVAVTGNGTANGYALYTANPGTSNISTFTVSDDCEPSLVGSRIPTPGPPADIQVKPDGQCLAVSSPNTDSVAMYSIGPQHLLTPAGIFPVPGPGTASGLEFSQPQLGRDSLYVAKADPDEIVIVGFKILPDCKLANNPGITRTTKGRAASVIRLDPDNRCLFVMNQRTETSSLLTANHPPSRLTSFAVEPGTGELRYVTTVDDVAFYPSGLEFGETLNHERFVYYTSFSREILRRPVLGCQPGEIVAPTARTGVPGTGLLRGLTIIQ
jgi:hypothetical protein